MITLADYFMGRDRTYQADLTPQVLANATKTVARANELLARAAADGVSASIDQMTKTHVASGWRPATVNSRTANAGAKSTHISARGIDVQDSKDRALARWCVMHQLAMAEVGIWMECPMWTGGIDNADPWCHWQTEPPSSGRRIYIPSTKPAGDPGFYKRYGLATLRG